jgi:hypothetical protein
MMPANLYSTLGLRGNPFAAGGRATVPQDLWIDRGLPDAPRAELGCLIQVIGERGAGKTAHLLRWQTQTGGPLRYVPAGLRRWRPLPVGPITYWDEADRVPSPLLLAALRRAARIGATVVVGTHADLSRIALAAGLEVSTHFLSNLDTKMLIAWARLRIEAARLPGVSEAGLALDPDTAARIIAECGASLRATATRLHVWAAELASSAARLTAATGLPDKNGNPT